MIATEGRIILNIYRDLVVVLGDMVDEYFRLGGARQPTPSEPGFRLSGNDKWPTDCKWIACYAVTGGSEGHYIHVDVIRTDQSRDMVFLGKTFQGMEHAQKMAARLAEELGA